MPPMKPRDRQSTVGLLPRMEARVWADGSKVSYRYHPLGGKPISLGTDKAAAIRKVLDLNGDAPDTGTIGGLWRQYQKTVYWKKLAETTRVGYTEASLQLLKRFEKAPAAAIRPTDIARYLRTERAEAPVRANREVALLSNLLNLAVENGLIDVNPCKQVRRNPESPSQQTVDGAELQAFLEWLDKQSPQRRIVGMMAEFAALAGNRRCEFLTLSRPQIDREGGVVRIKRAKQRGIERVEVIEISPPMAALLDRLLALPSAADRLYVFTDRDGNAYGERAFKSMWARIMAAAIKSGTIKEKFKFHSLRAFYATTHKKRTGELPDMHANPATTARVYDRNKEVNRRSL